MGKSEYESPITRDRFTIRLNKLMSSTANFQHREIHQGRAKFFAQLD